MLIAAYQLVVGSGSRTVSYHIMQITQRKLCLEYVERVGGV